MTERLSERELFAALGVPYNAPGYERDSIERAFPSPADSGRIGAVGCGGTSTDTMCGAGGRATTSVAGVSRLEVVAP